MQHSLEWFINLADTNTYSIPHYRTVLPVSETCFLMPRFHQTLFLVFAVYQPVCNWLHRPHIEIHPPHQETFHEQGDSASISVVPQDYCLCLSKSNQAINPIEGDSIKINCIANRYFKLHLLHHKIVLLHTC